MRSGSLWLWPLGLIVLWLLSLPLDLVLYADADRGEVVDELQAWVDRVVDGGLVRPWVIVLFALTALTHWTSFWKRRRRRPRLGLALLGLPWSVALGARWLGVNRGSLNDWGEGVLMTLLVLGPPALIFGGECLVGVVFRRWGERRFHEDELSAAAALLQLAQRFFPGDRSITKMTGLAHYRLHQWRSAEVALGLAREAFPRDADLCLPLARLALRREAWAEAVPLLRAHLDVHPRDDAALEKLSEAQLALGDLDAAVWAHEQLAHGEDVSRLRHLADLYLRQHSLERALETARRIRSLERPPHSHFVEIVDRVLAEEPTMISALRAMLEHVEDLNRPEEIHRWREQILQLQPKDEALRRKVMAYLRDSDQLLALERHLAVLLQGPEPAKDDLVEMVHLLRERGEWAGMAKWLERAKSRFPDAWEFLLAEAELALEQGDHERCLETCHRARARARSPEHFKPIDALLARLERVRSENELAALRKAIEEASDPLPLKWELVDRLTEMRAFDQVAAELDEILRRRPDQAERVTATVENLLAKSPRTFALLNFLRDVQMRCKEYDGVFETSQRMAALSLSSDSVMRESCEWILQENPMHAQSLEWLSHQARVSRDWQTSVELTEKRIEGAPALADDPDILQLLFEGHCALEEVQRAEESAQRLLDGGHRQVETLKALGHLYERHGRLREAHRCFQRAQSHDDQDSEVRDAIRRLEIEIRTERIHEIQMRLLEDSENTALNHELGDLLYSFDRFTEAIPHLQRASADPGIANLCRAKIAHALAMRGMLDLAFESLADVVIEADGPEQLEMLKAIHYNLAEIFREQGQTDRARETFKRLFRADAGYRNVVQKLEMLTQ